MSGYTPDQYMKLADQLLEEGKATAEENKEAKLRSSISRAYYSVLMLAKKYLTTNDPHIRLNPSEFHKNVIEEFGKLQGYQFKSIVNDLTALRKIRNNADYNNFFSNIGSESTKAVFQAKALTRKIQDQMSR